MCRLRELTADQQDMVLYGSRLKPFHFHYENDFGGVRDVYLPFEGVMNNIDRRYWSQTPDFTREQMRGYMDGACSACGGYRLNPAALSIKVGDKHIGQISEMPVDQKELLDFFKDVKFGEQDSQLLSQSSRVRTV